MRKVKNSERIKLKYIERKYGEEAMRLRLKSILARRITDKEWRELALQMRQVNEPRSKVMSKLMLTGGGVMEQDKEKIQPLEKDKGWRKVQKAIRPTLQSLMTLHVVHEVMPRYFSEAEIEELTDGKRDVAWVKEEVAKRSGRSWQEVMARVKEQVVHEYSEAMLTGADEMREMMEKKLVEPYGKAILTGDMSEWLKLSGKGI